MRASCTCKGASRMGTLMCCAAGPGRARLSNSSELLKELRMGMEKQDSSSQIAEKALCLCCCELERVAECSAPRCAPAVLQKLSVQSQERPVSCFRRRDLPPFAYTPHAGFQLPQGRSRGLSASSWRHLFFLSASSSVRRMGCLAALLSDVE